MGHDVTRHNAKSRRIDDTSRTRDASSTTAGSRIMPTLAPTPSVPSETPVPTKSVKATDKALLASLRSELGSPLEEIRRDWVGDYGLETELVGYRVNGQIAPQAMIKAQELISQAARPATRQELAFELTKLAAATQSAKRGIDLEAFMEVALEDLSEFPIDVVREAMRSIRRQQIFLPAVSEIYEKCKWINRKRRALTRLEFAS